MNNIYMYKRVNELLGTDYKNNDEIDWNIISKTTNLSEEFIEEFKDYVNWEIISDCQVLSENFIERYKYYVNWVYISSHQILSWDFIMEHKYEVDWSHISLYQPFIENSEWWDVKTRLLEDNKLYKLYQRTKERGWFVGYLDKDKDIFSLDPFYYYNNKVRIWWKDLSHLYKVKNYEYIRLIKYL